MTKKKPRKNVLRQLFDIKPVTNGGRLDWEKIASIRQIVNFTHLIEDYERSFTSRRMKLLTSDYRGNEIFRRYLSVKKPIFASVKPMDEEIESGLASVVAPKEIVLEYRPQVVRSIEILPSRDELLSQLENFCNNDFATIAEICRSAKNLSGVKNVSGPLFSKAKREFPLWFSELNQKLGLRKIKVGWRSTLTGLAALIVFVALTFPLSDLIEKNAGGNFKNIGSLKARENILKSRDLLAMVDFYQEAQTFEGFERDLIISKQKIDKISRALVGILENLPQTDVESVSPLVDLTKLFNQASENFASAIEFYSGRNFFSFLVQRDGNQETLTAMLAKSNQSFEQVLLLLNQIRTWIEKNDRSALPVDAADEILKLSDKTSTLAADVQDFLESNRFLLKFLGAEKQNKFLLVIQNPATPRATGGFVSGYAIAGLEKGIIGDLTAEDATASDTKIRERVIPPQPLQRLNISWGMSGANWFFDFPLSAQKLKWFEEKAGGPKVDYVIALSPRFFEDLLKITGSINLADAKKVVSSENFQEILTNQVRVEDSAGSGQFARLIAEFLPKFFQELANLEQRSSFRVLDLINKNLEEKNILIYASDPSEEDGLKKMNWAGEAEKTSGNFLAVVDSVVNDGLKNVGSFKKQIRHQAEIQPDGRIVNTLTLKYDYSGQVRSRAAKSVEVEPELRDFLRIFVPSGSELLEANVQEQEGYLPPLDYYAAGFRTDNDIAEMEYNLITDASGVQIFQEGEKTAFGFWVDVPLGESQTVVLKYRLPLRASGENDLYSFLLQKQPADYSDFETSLTFPKDYKPTGRSTENLQVFSNLVKLSGQLDKDKYYEVRFER